MSGIRVQAGDACTPPAIDYEGYKYGSGRVAGLVPNRVSASGKAMLAGGSSNPKNVKRDHLKMYVVSRGGVGLRSS